MGRKVIIVGAGFAGLAAAGELGKLARRRQDITVSLFDKNPYTTMIPALPDVSGGRYDKRHLTESIRKRIDPSIALRVEAVTSLDLNARTVVTRQGAYPYDHLVIAAGSVTNRFGFDQHIEAVHQLDGLDDANRIQHEFGAYLRKTEQPVVVIAGGGYTGFEIACNLRFAGRRVSPPPDIYIVELKDRVLPLMDDWVRGYLRRQAEARGIHMLTSTSVDTFDGSNVTLSNGRKLEDVFLCWTTGTRFAIEDVRGRQDQVKDGRFQVDAFLRVPRHQEVFAAGDAAAVEFKGGLLRKAVNFSLGSGRQAGRNIVNAIENRPLQPFRPVDLGWVIPFCDVAVGRILSRFKLRGRLPLCLHYTMCGLRNYNAANRAFFWRLALRSLRR